ncbi:MAG: molecular chaperone [Candidatus Parabeggiatoa sp. nov. 2]|nr:MAG: molecular chaperone [Beggiatoa sp. 4572_84]RKZ58570.1 MAG: molecular chaperone [Gammaproteobacteria bacterium]
MDESGVSPKRRFKFNWMKEFNMYAGLDYGTSTCSIGVWQDGKPQLLPLEDASPYILSTLYTPKQEILAKEIDENELRKRVANAKREQTRKKHEGTGEKLKFFSDAEFANRERAVLKREAAEKARRDFNNQEISESLLNTTEIYFGEKAVQKHLTDPLMGHFVKSPKVFLGSQLKSSQLNIFSEIVARMLANIKETAESLQNQEISQVVIGRPINFHGTRGEVGNKQALRILEQAAIIAGFKQVEFLFEPVAAALDYERTLFYDQTLLVLDVGGGTTDCSMIKVGPSYSENKSRYDDLLGTAGDRFGGIDLDIKLNMQSLMPYFGKDSLLSSGLPIPYAIFWDAVSINDVNAQARFASEKTWQQIQQILKKATEPEKVGRLKVLHEGKYTYRLNRSAELAKILLSERELIELPLRYIEPELVLPITRKELSDAIEMELDKIGSLLNEVIKQAGVSPEAVYVTGGTVKSPIVESFVTSIIKDAPIIIGDLFGSVTTGLTTWAKHYFS